MSVLTSGLTATMSTFYDKIFLQRAKLLLRHDSFAQKRGLPANQGKVISFTRHTIPSLATTALTEGANPAEASSTGTAITATLAEYGAYESISSFYSRTSIDVKLREQVALMGQHLGETIDTVIRTEFLTGQTSQVASGNVTYTNSSSVASTDVLNSAQVRRATRTLKKNKALPIKGSQGNPVFGAIIGPEAAMDLLGDSTWQAIQQYVTPERMERGILGTYFGVEFVETNNNYITSTPAYITWISGDQAIGVVSIDSEDVVNPGNSTLIIKDPGPSDTSNPLNRFSTIGWQVTFVPKTLNTLWTIELYTGVSV